MLRFKLTAVGIKYNYVIVSAQTTELKKNKKLFRLSLQGFGPNMGINSNTLTVKQQSFH